MIRIYPGPANEIDVDTAYSRSVVSQRSGDVDRPQVALCMVSSLDGSIALSGASAALSHPTDRRVLLRLRELADLIIVGAGTVREEDYGPPRKPGQRIGVVSRYGHIDLSLPLFTTGAGFLILPEDAPHVEVETVRAGRGGLDLYAVLRRLPGAPDRVQVEGGARLNGAFTEVDLFDEVNLTMSPGLVGGDGPRLSVGAAENLRAFGLAQLCVEDDFVFARYARQPR